MKRYQYFIIFFLCSITTFAQNQTTQTKINIWQNGTSVTYALSEIDSLTFTRDTTKDDTTSKYCEYTARFHVDNVTSYPILAKACTSLGEFCTITMPIGGSGKVYVKNYVDINYIEATEIQKYTGGVILGLGAGLIIGKPSTPLLSEESEVKCYDLCCPNCFEEYNITKQLTLEKNNDNVTCSRCGRTYDLNNLGIVNYGTAGRSLFNYKVTYFPTSSSLTVSNR